MSVCPRTGQPCSNPKNFAIAEVTPQGTKTIQCCQQCVLGPGVKMVPLTPGSLPVLNNSLGQLQEMMQKAAAAKAPTSSKKCPSCGVSPDEIEKTNQFGCPGCYDAFRDDIETMLMNHHGDMIHNGKVPKAWKKRKDRGEPKESTVDRTLATVKRHKNVPLAEQIKHLEQRLAESVKAEDYEKAALLRDVISQMKVSVSVPPPVSLPPSDLPSETP